jgi:hypothetical protein
MFAISRSTLSDQARRVRYVKLGLSISPVVGAYFYSRTHQMPPLICPFRFLTGIPCPGCGMTRSFLAIARGDVHQAVFYNLFGPVLFAIFLLAVIHITLELTTGHKIKTFYTQLWNHKKLKSLSLTFILIYHTGRLIYLAKSGYLISSFQASPLGTFLF